jgi:quercetin dioxygenase-like cupin family protein
MTSFLYYRDRVGSFPDQQFKVTLFQGEPLRLGLNCVELGQSQHAHTHGNQDKFYFVVEGSGRFEVGDETRRSAKAWWGGRRRRSRMA